MMDEKETYYNIPSNFIDQGRIINGMFRTRYFIEGAVLALVIGGLMFSFLKEKETSVKIVWITLTAGPVFLLGVSGIGGYPLSVNLINLRHWMINRKKMTYDFTLKPLKQTPLEAMEQSETPGDRLIDAYNEYKKKREEKLADPAELSPWDVVHEKDEDLKGLLLFEEKKQERAPHLRKRKLKKMAPEPAPQESDNLQSEIQEIKTGNAVQKLEKDVLF